MSPSLNGHCEVVKGGCDVDKAMNDGATPLYMAAQEGHGEVAATRIDGRCQVDKDDITGFTPLYIAATGTARWCRR